MPNTHLLIIDPQNDFCDLPPAYLPKTHDNEVTYPQLPVTGAHGDMQRLAHFITAQTAHLDGITVTFDSHHAYGIERPAFWRMASGETVAPFTTITAREVIDGTYTLTHALYKDRVVDYLHTLEKAGRYTHMVWPAHCEIGTWGHNVHEDVRMAYTAWEKHTGQVANKVFKGTNPLVEHYSAIRAEVIDPDDPATNVNTALLATWDDTDMLLVAGEAGSHCVRSTVEHIVQYRQSAHPMRIIMLVDCISPVKGFEIIYTDFLKEAGNLSIEVMTTNEVAQLLSAY